MQLELTTFLRADQTSGTQHSETTLLSFLGKGCHLSQAQTTLPIRRAPFRIQGTPKTRFKAFLQSRTPGYVYSVSTLLPCFSRSQSAFFCKGWQPCLCQTHWSGHRRETDQIDRSCYFSPCLKSKLIFLSQAESYIFINNSNNKLLFNELLQCAVNCDACFSCTILFKSHNNAIMAYSR